MTEQIKTIIRNAGTLLLIFALAVWFVGATVVTVCWLMGLI